MQTISGFCDMVRRAAFIYPGEVLPHATRLSLVVRESCYPSYELSYIGASHGCSKKKGR